MNVAASLALAAIAAARARRGGHPGRWGAAAFAALALVLLVSVIDEDVQSAWVTKPLVCLLLAFPYLLLRFTASFGGVPAAARQAAALLTVAVVAATLILPALPEEGEPRPGWAVAYLVAVVAFWTALSLATVVLLWRAGRGRPTLTRRRARLMSGGTAGINVLILLAATGDGAGEVVVQALLLVSLASFAVGYAPPPSIRLWWRQPEQRALQRATEQLVEATTVAQVSETLLPRIARIVGGPGAVLRDAEQRVVASYGVVPPIEGGPEAAATGIEVVTLSPPFGDLVVATSPLTPFFGREELGLLHALGALADISLARCALGDREREAQVALREAMERAERANAAKSEFLSRMSHELRTPLNVVLGFGQILEMRGSLAPKDREAVASILKAGRHLVELINEVLDLSRIESGRMAISPEPVELADLVGEALDLIRPLAEERSIRLRAEPARCHRHVTADRQRLKQILLNLLSNAIKYNHDGGEIELSCVEGRDDARLRLQVADTGPGIPEAMMDRLFEPFERLGAEARHVEGTGLGLALSRQLIQLMGGEIGVDSQPGEGSTFWIELPTADAPDRRVDAEPPGASAGAPSPPRTQQRVLLVEDNLANFKLIEALLADRGHIELLPAMTGGLGLELAREHRPALILLDQHLPDVTGGEVLHRLKAHPDTRDIPVVIVSADATAGQVRRMRELGAAEYLTKPLHVSTFLRVLDSLLDEGGRPR